MVWVRLVPVLSSKYFAIKLECLRLLITSPLLAVISGQINIYLSVFIWSPDIFRSDCQL